MDIKSPETIRPSSEKIQQVGNGAKTATRRKAIIYTTVTLALLWLLYSPSLLDRSLSPPHDFSDLALHCADKTPIGNDEFYARQTALARVLHADSAIYVAEPGANSLYYGNFSQSEWKLSERPLLLMVTPTGSGEDVEADVVVLTPKFEATRAKLLPIPAANISYVAWAEEANPYEIAASAFVAAPTTVYVDPSVRHFIVDGIQKALPSSKVVMAPNHVRQLRERKTAAELELMTCANEAVLLAVRAVHKRLYAGIRESQARSMVADALAAVGLHDGSCLTLFGDNAALPHGAGTDRVLGANDYALFDCSADLHGYQSDLTRTVALPDADIPADHRLIWDYVKAAQLTALRTAKAGVEMRKVDEAARDSLKVTNYASYFTHRLGHGIGLEVHEDPYLRGGNDLVIKTGHTFSDEPGVYIEGKVGVRLEDCFYIDEETGEGVLFTAGVGGQAISPWSP
ncbi:peptidase M24, structural domain-containing protein [Schizophyllum amplum]|uniref:Peptidase M24, structural domain-containing protein n=1 Tax=Schizophyllum amplum TaxID=97359 RepID=A0A550CD12_9AGAR|nr:peptidase M24, structural domain-containing protein [Auriculariopsis ampla]